MTKPKHVKYLEDFSERINGLDLEEGDVIGFTSADKDKILLHLVEDVPHELLSLSPSYVEVSLSRGRPYLVDSAFLVIEGVEHHNLQPGTDLYRVQKGTELYDYAHMMEGMNLPQGSVVPLNKSRTLTRLIRKLETHGLGHSRKRA